MNVVAILVWLLLAATLILGFQVAPKDENRKRQLISAHGLVLMMLIIYLLLPSATPVFLSDEAFLYWAPDFSGHGQVIGGLLLVWLSVVVFLGSYAIFRPRPRAFHPAARTDHTPVSAGLVLLLLILTGIGVLMKSATIPLSGGIDMMLVRMSGGVSQQVGIARDPGSMVTLLRSLSMIGDLAAAWLFVLALRYRRGRLAASLILLLVMAVSFGTVGKRLVLLWPLLVVAIAVSRYVFPIRPRHVLLIISAAFALGWITLLFRIYAPLSVTGDVRYFNPLEAPWAQGTAWGFYFNSLEFSFFDLTVAAIGGREQIIDMFGGHLEMIYRVHIEPFSYIVPRAIWAGKPEMLRDISHALMSLISGRDLATVESGVAASLVGTAWLSGGPVGSVVAFGVLGLIAAGCDRFFLTSSALYRQGWALRIIIYAFLLMVVFHLFRQGTFGWVFIITIGSQLGGVVGLLGLVLFNMAHARPRRDTRKLRAAG
jgi:hypothetical protein